MVFKKSKQSGTSWAQSPAKKVHQLLNVREKGDHWSPLRNKSHTTMQNHPHKKSGHKTRSLICTAFKNNRKNSFNDKFNIKKNIPTFYVLHIHIHPIVKRQITAAVRLPKARGGTGRDQTISAFDMNYTVQPPLQAEDAVLLCSYRL